MKLENVFRCYCSDLVAATATMRSYWSLLIVAAVTAFGGSMAMSSTFGYSKMVEHQQMGAVIVPSFIDVADCWN